MSTQQISVWFDEGIEHSADYMLLAKDTLLEALYPVYCTVDDFTKKFTKYSKSMQQIMSVYDLNDDKEIQLNEMLPYHGPDIELTREMVFLKIFSDVVNPFISSLQQNLQNLKDSEVQKNLFKQFKFDLRSSARQYGYEPPESQIKEMGIMMMAMVLGFFYPNIVDTSVQELMKQ